MKEALEERGLLPDEFLEARGRRLRRRLLLPYRRNIEALERADGLFAYTDVMAFGAIRALTDEGVEVPRDLRVVGYDDIEIANWVRPGLTTVHQPREEVARLATDRLFDLLEGRGGGVERRTLIAPFLVRRESC